MNIMIGDEAESAWLVCTLILQYYTVFYLAKVAEVFLEASEG